MEYIDRKSLLENACWFAEHNQVETALSLVEEAFDNFMEFRAWWLTNSNPEYRLFSKKFINWVAKTLVMMYISDEIYMKSCPKDLYTIVMYTYYEIYSE